jgi:hypothetical protein
MARRARQIQTGAASRVRGRVVRLQAESTAHRKRRHDLAFREPPGCDAERSDSAAFRDAAECAQAPDRRCDPGRLSPRRRRAGRRFEGERLSGEVLEGGADWQAVRSDGGTSLDVRLVLKTTDDALIAMTYRGIRQGPAEAIARLEKGEAIDPASYYFRTAPLFETASPQYAWLNNIIAIGVGHRFADGPVYSVFEVL